MSDLRLLHKGGPIVGKIVLGGSKSITNRAYIIRALCQQTFDISNASDSDDSQSLLRLLNQKEGVLDAGHAGTTFRFLTAFFAFQPGSQLLTGSERMQQRPIGPLVDALRQLGAHIEYVNNEGYPPIQIGEAKTLTDHKVSLPGDVSSQFISALLLVAPSLDNGLEITFTGELVSAPYLQMTLDIMGQFGVKSEWKGNTITVRKQDYHSQDFVVEADWSSASYFFSIAALAEEAAITLKGLFVPSMQGDSAIADIARSFGVNTKIVDANTILITKAKEATALPLLEYDFLRQPDIAQTVFAMCAGKGVNGLFTGLQTLKIKETDRIRAMQTELAKMGVFLSKVPQKFHQKDLREMYMMEGKASFDSTPVFDTYHDHRMAMALAPLALNHPIQIKDAGVVSKSYPNFWQDLETLGFEVKN